jgi:hypothetical protein
MPYFIFALSFAGHPKGFIGITIEEDFTLEAFLHSLSLSFAI